MFAPFSIPFLHNVRASNNNDIKHHQQTATSSYDKNKNSKQKNSIIWYANCKNIFFRMNVNVQPFGFSVVHKLKLWMKKQQISYP